MEKKSVNELVWEAYPEVIKNITLDDGTVESVDINKRTREAFRIGYLTGQNEDFIKSIREETKKSILSKLPKWKIATRDVDSECIEFLVKYKYDGSDGAEWDEVIPTNRLHKDEWYLEISDLIELGV